MSGLPRKDKGKTSTKIRQQMSAVVRREILQITSFYSMREVSNFLQPEFHGGQLSKRHSCKDYPLSKSLDNWKHRNPESSFYVSVIIPGKLFDEPQPGNCSHLPMMILDFEGENAKVFVFDSNYAPVVPYKALCPVRGYFHVYPRSQILITPMSIKTIFTTIFYISFMFVNRNKSPC